MRKNYLLISAAALSLTAGAMMGVPYLAESESGGVKSVPYFTELGADDAWINYDVNGDGKTWASTTDGNATTGTKNSIKYTYHNSNSADDWYISPAIHLEAGKEYKTKVWYKCNSGTYEEKFSLYYTSAGDTPQDLAAGTEISDVSVTTTSWTQDVNTFTVEETGDYYFGFWAHSDPNKFNLFLTGFSIAENVFAPASVSNLKVTPGENRALSATLSWELPTKDLDGVALPEDAVFDAVTVYRDGREMDVLDGTATEWEDDATKGLTSGEHTYEVMVTVNGANSAKALVKSAYIGPLEAYSLPYEVDFPNYDQEKFNLFWTVVAGRNSNVQTQWKYSPSSYYGNRFEYYPGSSKTADDWLISPSMKFTKPGAYRLALELQFGSNPINIDVLLGEGTTIGGFETEIGNIQNLSSSKEERYIYFEVETPGEYALALHCDFASTGYSTLYVYNFKVEESKEVPAQVADLKSEVNDDASVTLTWTNPSKSNIDKDLESLDKVEVYCDGELAQTLDNVTPGQEMTTTHTPEGAGVHKYYVLPYNSEGAAEGTPVEITTDWVGDETQALPYDTYFSVSDPSTPIWKGFDANGDGISWNVSAGGAVMKKPTDFGRSDDYLMAPYMDLVPGYYTLKYTYKGGAKNRVSSIGIVKDKKNVAATFTKLGEFKALGQSYGSDYKVTVCVEEAGKYAFTLHSNDYASSSDYDETISHFSVEYIKVVPAVVSGLTVTPDAELGLAADISWTNPTETNIEGVAAADLTKAVIKRDGVQIAEVTEGLVPGEETVYTDTTIPSAGVYTYSVEIYNADGCSAQAAPSVKSSWIGGGLDLPFECNGEFNKADWTIHNVNGDKRAEAAGGGELTWEVNSSYINITSNNTTPDDWLVSPRLTIEHGKVYDLTVSSYTGYNYDPIDWDLHLGTSTHYSDMTVKVATVHTSAQLKKDAQDDVFQIVGYHQAANSPRRAAEDEPVRDSEAATFVEPGVYTVGIHANNKGALSLSNFNMSGGLVTAVGEIKADGEVIWRGNTAIFFSEADEVVGTDMAGRVVLTADHVKTLDLSDLGAGVYMISAVCADKKVTLKVIVK